MRDLSLNFWLVMPIFTPDVAPVLHPCLEGLFNFLLAWAALFSGFLIDGKTTAIGDQITVEEKERGGKEPKNAFLPYVLGMQLLTNAILLPYLVLRKPWMPPPSSSPSYALTKAEKFGESKLPTLAFFAIGLLSLGWAVVGRQGDFGDVTQRLSTFSDIVSSDRLTFSFVVDCLYFWVFQGWLMDDDLARRGVKEGKQGGPNLTLAKAVPFFGMVYYLLARPSLPQTEQKA